jgi:hypothetical protein
MAPRGAALPFSRFYLPGKPRRSLSSFASTITSGLAVITAKLSGANYVTEKGRALPCAQRLAEVGTTRTLRRRDLVQGDSVILHCH